MKLWELLLRKRAVLVQSSTRTLGWDIKDLERVYAFCFSTSFKISSTKCSPTNVCSPHSPTPTIIPLYWTKGQVNAFPKCLAVVNYHSTSSLPLTFLPLPSFQLRYLFPLGQSDYTLMCLTWLLFCCSAVFTRLSSPLEKEFRQQKTMTSKNFILRAQPSAGTEWNPEQYFLKEQINSWSLCFPQLELPLLRVARQSNSNTCCIKQILLTYYLNIFKSLR